MGLLKPLLAVLVAAGIAVSAHAPALADTRASKINQNTLGLLAADSQWLQQAMTIASVVQHDKRDGEQLFVRGAHRRRLRKLAG